MLDGATIAAILTGILALLGALATAWLSGLNEQRVEVRRNRKALARYSVPLLVASWDLAIWLYDMLEDDNYSPRHCEAWGSELNSQFTSYLFGQYFAGAHIIREMTQLFAHLRGGRAEQLKRLLWKIEDEFISMHYDGRESRELRWFKGDILAAQEAMAVKDEEGLRPMHWIEFQKNYDLGPENGMRLKKVFGRYEDECQRIVYRRFKYLYATEWKDHENPQSTEKMGESFGDDEKARKRLEEEEKQIAEERQADPNIVVVMPDHRLRRLQHLLADLVPLLPLDEKSNLKIDRPVRKCRMMVDKRVLTAGMSEGFQYRIPCDCDSFDCNPMGRDFVHRDLTASSGRGVVRREAISLPALSRPQPRRGRAG
ncbi:hypothetical protein QBC34DRAFT_448132 [Podospora aff. communis PSN243]|uniref:Uncharacterized protein n=1 Tax=Podospora aff. communis PSN243 TaxID=3040156 RepID=A0AAV9GR41_9PEZI|nr:hypothetical protein QBC34DRAFT_448132 [Podospora aff. communis PSN243]